MKQTNRQRFCELFWCWLTADVCAHAPLSNEAILALFRSDTEEADFSDFPASEVVVTVGDCAFNLNSKRSVCPDVFWCLCCLCLCSLSSVCVGFFLLLSLTVDVQCLFLLLLLSSSCFNVMSPTFTSWVVAPYLVRAPYTWSECNFV